MRVQFLLLTILAMANRSNCDYVGDSDAFHDVIHFKYGQFSTVTHLTQADLDPMYHEVFERGQCAEKTDNCEQCLETILSVFIPDEVETIEQWNRVSAAVLYGLLDTATFCNMTADEMVQLNTTDALLAALATNHTRGIGEEQIELLLDTLADGFSGEEDHSDETTSPVNPTTTSDVLTTTGNETSEDHNDEEHGEEHGEEHEPHETNRCFGEGTLLYYMGLDHEDVVYGPKVAEMAGIVVSFLVQDWLVDETCQVLPKQSDILAALFETLSGGTELITEEGFEELLERLNIGSIAGAPTEVPTSDDGHNHKRSIRISARSKRSTNDEPPTSRCMGEGTLAAVYGLELDEGINRDQFIQLCPALVQQQISGACDPLPTTTSAPVDLEVSLAQTYGYGTLAVVIISLLSILGVLLIPCLHTLTIQYFLSFFVAMGVGTMLGDSLLHLMPQALGLHDHGAEEEHVGGTISATVGVQLITFLAIYLFWLFETLMTIFLPNSSSRVAHGHSHWPPASADMEKDGKTAVNSHEAEGTLERYSPTHNRKCSDSSKGSTAELKSKSSKGVPSVALMLLIGDGLHNFIDGIAIGAAFSNSLQDGLGTSIAVFCHELPHELGDFSMLLSIGMSKVKAIVFNMLSASVCLIGFFVGAAAGNSSDNAKTWLLALTAGMFIYISLVDMMPELMNPNKAGKLWIHILMQNLGMLIGLALMLIIAVYEEDILHFE